MQPDTSESVFYILSSDAIFSCCRTQNIQQDLDKARSIDRYSSHNRNITRFIGRAFFEVKQNLKFFFFHNA